MSSIKVEPVDHECTTDEEEVFGNDFCDKENKPLKKKKCSNKYALKALRLLLEKNCTCDDSSELSGASSIFSDLDSDSDSNSSSSSCNNCQKSRRSNRNARNGRISSSSSSEFSSSSTSSSSSESSSEEE